MALELHMATAEETLMSGDRCLVDLVDGLLERGVVIRADIWLSVAEVDLVFLGADLVLASQDRMQRERTGL